MDISNLSTDCGRVLGSLRSQYEKYASADDRPGDLDSRPDRVELSDGNTSIKVALHGGIWSKSFDERVELGNGTVQITSVRVPRWFHVLGSAHAEQVTRSGQNYAGSEVVHEQNGSILPNVGFAYYTERSLAAADARAQFTRLESKFNARA